MPNNQPSPASKAVEATALPNPRRELAKISLFLLVLLVASLAGALGLLKWKAAADIAPVVTYSQMVWSEENPRLAFMASERKPHSEISGSNSLYVTDIYGENPTLLRADLPAEAKTLGWFAKDTKVVVSAPNNDPKNPLSLIEYALDDTPERKFNFPGKDLAIVGRSAANIYLARSYGTDASHQTGVELLLWSSNDGLLKSVTTIPNRDSEELHIQSVAQSPDNRKLAVSILACTRKAQPEGKATATEPTQEPTNQSTPSTASPAPASGEAAPSPIISKALGVWLFDFETQQLSFTSIAAEQARDLRLAWSKDSAFLVGTAWYGESSQLFLLTDAGELDSATIKGTSPTTPASPIIPGFGRQVLLPTDGGIISYDFETRSLDMVLDSSKLGMAARDLAISNSSNFVAFTAKIVGLQAIFTTTLNPVKPSRVSVPTKSAKPSLAYAIAAGLEYAGSCWGILPDPVSTETPTQPAPANSPSSAPGSTANPPTTSAY